MIEDERRRKKKTESQEVHYRLRIASLFEIRTTQSEIFDPRMRLKGETYAATHRVYSETLQRDTKVLRTDG